MTSPISSRAQLRAAENAKPALRAENRVLRLLNPRFDEMSSIERAALHHDLMWTIQALTDSGFTVEYPQDEQPEKKERDADQEGDLYVCPLNRAFEGPLPVDDAITAALGRVYASSEEVDRVRASIEAGDPGPWHFVYGFTSVTIQRGYPQ